MIAVAWVATERLAPEEMPLFDDTARAWLRRPHGRRRRDDRLGFGLNEAVPVVTLAALTAASAAVEFLRGATVEAGHREGAIVIIGSLRRVLAWLRRRDPAHAVESSANVSAGPAEVPRATLVRIRDLTYERLLATGLPAERAALVADAVVGALVVAKDGPGS